MNSQEAANLATREANPVIDGRKANVNLAYLGAKPRVIPTAAGKADLSLIISKKRPTNYSIEFKQMTNSRFSFSSSPP